MYTHTLTNSIRAVLNTHTQHTLTPLIHHMFLLHMLSAMMLPSTRSLYAFPLHVPSMCVLVLVFVCSRCVRVFFVVHVFMSSCLRVFVVFSLPKQSRAVRAMRQEVRDLRPSPPLPPGMLLNISVHVQSMFSLCSV
jgi:hypothetical protein